MGLAQQFIQLPVWAVVGASENPDKFGYKITVRLQSAGKEVFPSTLNRQINGREFYPDLSSLPKLPDVDLRAVCRWPCKWWRNAANWE